MFELELSTSLLIFCLFPLLFWFVINVLTSDSSSNSDRFPRSYPLSDIYANRNRRIEWLSDILTSAPSNTFVLKGLAGRRQVFTANPSTVQHILKTRFHVYQKGYMAHETKADLLGDGIFNVDGENWKFQRQVASHEFNTKSLRKFVEQVVDTELSNRLIPMLSAAAANQKVLDLQDILQRFTFDNICQIAFGYDAGFLLPSLPDAEFARAFETAVKIISQRTRSVHPLVWKIKRHLNVGSVKQLRIAVKKIRGFAKRVIIEKQEELNKKSALESVDLLSRFLVSGHSEENFVTDIIISFILAGRDTTSAALVWFFWLVFKHPDVENEIMKDIGENSEGTVYEEVNDMVYTHASLSETMRLYPPVPFDGKEAQEDDVLPDGTLVKKGTRIAYSPYAMGRLDKIWGKDWAEFRPERWLERDTAAGKLRYVAKDAYTYSVFQAGPRICLGKEMAYLQMKRVAAGVLRRFRVVPALEEGVEPVYTSYMTSKMKGGFPVRIEERV